MGSLPITYCTDFPGTNKILSLSWRDLSLNKCRVTTTRIWLGGGGGGRGHPDVSLSHAILTLLVTRSISSHTLTLLSFDTVGKVGKYLTSLHPFSVFSRFFWYWGHKNKQFWKIGQKLSCYFPLWWHPVTTDDATFGMLFISLDTITHAILGMLFNTIAIVPIFN